MIGAISASTTGLDANQVLLDVTSNNLANLNTPGFKASQVSFREVLTAAGAPAGVAVAGVSQSAAPEVAGGSNVNPALEMVNLLLAKHAHAANTRAIIAANRMLTDTLSHVP
jgi:flagellar basal body rod protein FlgG